MSKSDYDSNLMLRLHHIIVFLILLISPLIALSSDNWCSSDGANGPYKFEWKPNNPKGASEGTLKITERSTGKIFQEVSGYVSEENWSPDFSDLNFDGCPDIGWIEFNARASANVILLYDRAKQRFEHSVLLSELLEPTVISKKNKCLQSTMAGRGSSGGNEIHCWRGNKLVHVESTYWDWNEKKECQETVVERLKKGKLRKVSVKCEKIEQDDSVWQGMYKR
ncbi:hypothetical protein [Methylophilus sp. 14]|uniref:XAC2610-related protein n=1 Tax=Methylophilus sp. 14 TaxID=2781019 RepID=UPI00188F8249|nr:hypothetical protein [Methylophilus sp. 14]MBF4987809.1 hypothetical protein [Methylophilus sp. 14]